MEDAAEVFALDGQEIHILDKGKTVYGNKNRIVAAYPVVIHGNGHTLTCMSDAEVYGNDGFITASRGKVKLRGKGCIVLAKEIDCINPQDNTLTLCTDKVLILGAGGPFSPPLPPATSPSLISSLDSIAQLPAELILKRKRVVEEEEEESDDEESGPPARKLRRRNESGMVTSQPEDGKCRWKYRLGNRKGKFCLQPGAHRYSNEWFCEEHLCPVCKTPRTADGRVRCKNCPLPDTTITLAEAEGEQDVRRILKHEPTGRNKPAFVYLVEWEDNSETWQPASTFIADEEEGEEAIITQALLDYWAQNPEVRTLEGY